MTDKPVLLTGASGLLGRLLAARLGALGWCLRLTDVKDFPDALPPNASFTRLDLEDRAGVFAVAEDCGFILHFGGISTEQPFEAILGPNLRGTFHIYEAARHEKARVVYASSVHVVGLHERTAKLDQDCPLRPDGYYGLSKAYGEMLARMYWEKHEVESVLIRIGSTLPKPTNERFLSTWLSHDDFISLIACSRAAARVGCAIVWGASNNSRSFWRHDARAVIGWTPRDSSDDHLEDALGVVTDDPVAEHFQGGVFVSADYTRDGFPPGDMPRHVDCLREPDAPRTWRNVVTLFRVENAGTKELEPGTTMHCAFFSIFMALVGQCEATGIPKRVRIRARQADTLSSATDQVIDRLTGERLAPLGDEQPR